jgi:(4S)-4-hydroxy-5-phosphonooxypentane-2,3-dione isomerase
MAASRKHIDENAQMSCEREPGCRRFAVLVPKAANDRNFLYEICDRRAAFGTHLPSTQLATFNTTGADLVMNENVAKLDPIFEGSNKRR